LKNLQLSPPYLKWLLRFYPPLLFQRIWTVSIGEDFSTARVILYHSILNKNGYRSIFGGSISSAGDPFFIILYYGYFFKKGYRLKVWLKSCEIQFLKPAFTNLKLDFSLLPDDFQKAEISLIRTGKFIGKHKVEAKNKSGEICATIATEVYLRNTDFRVNDLLRS
jgi:hypothetical protein